MKTIALVSLAAFAFAAYAQYEVTQPNDSDRLSAVAPCFVTERGPHHRIWTRVGWETNKLGWVVARTNSYVELATGMHYLEGGEWRESKEEIEILPHGAGAAAAKGQHKVIFPPDIYDGVIEMQLPDGLWLRSRVLGLSYFDEASGTSVLIAETTNSVGELHGSNVVIFPEFLTDFRASLRLTYTKSGFEQDIILLEQPPSCKEWGMDPATTKLQVLTEFFDPPQPAKRELPVTDSKGNLAMDEVLDFPGDMQMGFGKAFSLESGLPEEEIPVTKQWIKLEDRDFLVEEVEVSAVEKGLEMLPKGASLSPGTNAVRLAQLGKPALPARRQARATNKPMRMAQAGSLDNGFVLDYVTMNTSLTNYTFRGDMTYYISGNASFYGTNTTFEGGTVLKYTNNATLTVNTPVKWQGGSYLPVALVARDDNTIGEIISGSTGNPGTTLYAANALYFNASTANTNLVLQNLRVANAMRAISINTRSGHVLRNVQIVKCGYGLALTNAEVSLRNALMESVRTNFTGSSSTGRVEHLTSHKTTRINGNIGSNLFITNSLLVLVTNATSFTSVNNRTNGAASGVFTNVGSGFHYLVAGSTNRNVGTTNINAALLAQLKALTTYPPLVYSNVTIAAATNWTIQAHRDTSTNDLPDVGYHYEPLDYCVSGVNASSTLTLTNGVAVGIFGPYGFQGGTVVSVGTPTNYNHIALYSAVQEQPVAWGTNAGATYLLSSWSSATRFRFTDISLGGSAGFGSSSAPGSLEMRDCTLRAAKLTISGGYLTTLGFTNNVIERCDFVLLGCSGSGYFANFYNNLFLNTGNLGLGHACDGSVLTNFAVINNLFVNSSFTYGAYMYAPQISNNGYYNTTTTSQGAWPQNISTLDFQTGALGNYYYPASGSGLARLINAGSASAAALSFYHYTTTTNQVKETNSTVDIGFHYIASSQTGQPSDFDGDTVPDYVEDTNGNGVVDAGETEWRVVITTHPQSQTIVAGNSVNFSVAATGQPLYYQWLFNGTNAIAGATSSSYAITSVTATNAGVYSVIVSNTFGSVLSSNATLTVTCLSSSSGLAAWWQAESNAVDNIGGLIGTLSSGASYAAGKVGTAFKFDGTNGYVQVPDSPTLCPTNFTVESWVKFDSLDSARSGGAWAGIQLMVMKQTPTNTEWGSYSLDKNRTGNGTGNGDYFEFNVTSASGENIWTESSPTIQTGVWYHVVGVRDSNFIQLYVNGQLADQASVGFAQAYGNQPLYLGSSGNPAFDGKLKGSLDEIGLYHRVLSSNEIAAIYLAGSVGRCPPPLSITLVNPVDGDTLTSPTQPILSAHVLGQIASATNVAFFANGLKIGDTASGTNGYYSLVWTNPPSTNCSLSAVVTDNQGVNTTSSVVNVTINAGTFIKGINLNGVAVTIEGNSWLSYQAATNAGLTISSNVTTAVQTNAWLVPPGDTNTQHMLQTMLLRQRLPATNVPTQFIYSKPDGSGTYNRLATLTNVPPGYTVTNLQYRAWCVEYGTSDPVGTYQASLYYSYGLPDPRFPYRSYNKVNYILNNKGGASLKDIQFAVWTVLGTDPSVFGSPDNLAAYQQLTNNANLYGADFVPGPNQIAGVILEATNAAMAQPILIEIQGTNKPISFILSQTLSNAPYAVYLWLAENEVSHLRSLDLKVQGTTVATNAGDLELGQWRKLGPYLANVTNGVLTVEIVSQAKGDPLLMGLAIYATNSVASNQPPVIYLSSPTNGSVFVAPAIVPINAVATDADGGIAKVDFFANGIAIGQDAISPASPYSFIWTGVAANGSNYILTAAATDTAGAVATSTNVQITVAAPVEVNPGTNFTILLTNSSATVRLDGSYSGGYGTITSLWTWAAGPSGVIFTNAAITNSYVTFTNKPGIYRLRLAAGNEYSTDSGVITIDVSSNAPPEVTAGPDRTIPYAANGQALLVASASDDGRPAPSALSLTWSSLNPAVTILNPNSLTATATNFPSNGVYRVQVVADDGLLKATNFMQVAVVPAGARTWTFDADFEEGTLLNVNYDEVPDQLQLNLTIEPFPYVWVACSDRSTVARIDVNTGQVLGEYRTTPEPRGNGNPSRTTVDKHGNVWVANRNDDYYWYGGSNYGGSITRVGVVIGGTRGSLIVTNIGGLDVTNFVANLKGEYLQPPFKYCTAIDRDHDGYIHTSFGVTNILDWDHEQSSADNEGGVTLAQDECILNYTRVPATGLRTIAVDRNNDVWIGGRYQGTYLGTNGQWFAKVDGDKGEMMTNTLFDVQTLNVSAYGGLVDGNGVLWSVGWDQFKLLQFDPSVRATNANYIGTATDVSTNGSIYGIGIDPKTGNIWYSDYYGGKVVCVNSAGLILAGYVTGGSNPKGVAVDNDGNVWVANTGDSTVSHLRTDGTFLGLVPLPCTTAFSAPMGVAIDANGKVWVAFQSGHALRIDPKKGPIAFEGHRIGAVDMIVPLNPDPNDNSSAPYNYSDMTGFVSLGSTEPSGIWTVTHDSGVTNMPWGLVYWEGLTNSDTRIKVEVRAATNETALTATNNLFLEVTNGMSFAGLGITGQVAEIRVTLSKNGGSTNTPVLYNLTLLPANSVSNAPNEGLSWATSDKLAVFTGSTSNLLSVLPNDALAANSSTHIVSWSSPRYGYASTNATGVMTTNIYGIVQSNAPGTMLLYTPTPGFLGADRFSYSISDGQGGWGRAVVVVSVIKTNPVVTTNDLPVIAADEIHVDEGSIQAELDVLVNDTAPTTLAIHSFTQPANGVVERVPCKLLYTPNRGFTGTNTFNYTVINSQGGRATTNVVVIVDGLSRPNLEILWGTNKLHSRDTILLSVTGTGVSVTNTLTLTNSGSADFNYLQGWSTTPVGGGFSVLEGGQPDYQLLAGGSTNIDVVFTSSVAGATNGTLLIQTNSEGRNPLRIYFSAMVSATTNGPGITLLSPLNDAELAGYSDISLVATNDSGSAPTNVVFVFQTTGGLFRIGEDATPPYSALWRTVPPGDYTLKAFAFDANNNVGVSSPVNVTVNPADPAPTNTPPIARDDELSIPLLVSGSTNYPVPVLANDSDANFDTLTIVDRTDGALGRVTKSGTILNYSPLAGQSGEDVFLYAISDGRGGMASARVLVHISSNPPPTVRIISPTDTYGRLPITFQLKSTASAGVTNVTYYDRSRALGNSTNVAGDYPVSWKMVDGTHYVVAVATDTNGLVGYSSTYVFQAVGPETNSPPVAVIQNFGIVDYPPDLQLEPQLPVVHEGITNLIGTASDGDGDEVSYRVLIYDKNGRMVRDCTPTNNPSSNFPGYHVGEVTDGELAELDLSGLANGTYEVELIVNDTWYENSTRQRFILDSQLKIGHFSFSVTDLTIPVSGIPLTIVRTYNSLSEGSGDFGPSWSLAINDLDVRINEQRANIVDDLDEVFSIRTGGGYDVSLTLPNGRRTTFYFDPRSSTSRPGVYYAEWTASDPNVHAELTPFGSPEFSGLGVPYWHANGWPCYRLEAFDFPGWELKTQDDTRYQIEREYLDEHDIDDVVTSDSGWEDEDITAASTVESLGIRAYGKARLARILQRSGDRVEIGRTSIQHFNAAQNPTRAIYLKRDALGRMEEIRDPLSGSNGLAVVKYHYDEVSSNLTQVEILVDRGATERYEVTTYQYTNANYPHFITGIIDARGVQVARNYYDEQGRLVGIVDAAGKTNRFEHDTATHREIQYDRSGQPKIFSYDPRGNVTNVLDALNRATSRSFNERGELTSITDALTNTHYFTYDAKGNQTSVADALNHTNYTAYNDFGQPIAMTNALGHVTRFDYDEHGNQTNMVDALTNHHAVFYSPIGKPAVIVDPLNRTNAMATYDAIGNLATLSNSFSGALITYDYDLNGNRTGTSNVWVNPNDPSDVRSVTNLSVFDTMGRETVSIDPDGKQTSVIYNEIGAQVQVIDGYNKATEWTYDARGNLIQITHSDGSVSQMVYDDNDRLSVTDDNHLPGVIANGTRMTYDAVGQVIKSERLTNVVITIDPGGTAPSSYVESIGGVISTNTFGYDLAGRQTAVTNAFGCVTRYEYNKLGQQTAVIDALSNRTDNVYDELGRLIFTTNAIGQVTQKVYDELGRVVRTIFQDDSFTAVEYDATGQRLFETNQLGLVTDFEYYDSGTLKAIVKPQVLDAEGGTNARPRWEFDYDNYSRLKLVRDPRKRETTFTADFLGRPATHSLPMGQTASQLYDAAGRLSRKVDFNGQTNEFIYDSDGRLATNQFYAVGSSVPTGAIAYTFDEIDRTKQIVEPRGTNSFGYDNQGHITSIVSPEGRLNYEYEPVGGRRVRVYTANSDLRYGYDELGRVKTVTVVKRNGATLVPPEWTTNTYTALGSLQDVYYPNGVHALHQYDRMSRLTNLTYTSSGSVLLAQYTYAPNTNGQWKSATEIVRQGNGTYVTNQLAWHYDNLGRLTNETSSSTLSALSYTNRYVLSLVGNRLWQTNIFGGVTETTGYTYNTNDQLLVESGAAISFTNEYDANGALTNRTAETETNAYVFNLQNRLGSAAINRTANGHTISETVNYTYDYKGNRVRAEWSRSVDDGPVVSGTNIFLNEPNSPAGLNQVLEELPAIGTTPTVTYTLGTRIVSQTRNGAVSHLLSDGHGSTRQLSDTDGGITAKYSYDAYGKGLDFTNDTQNAAATTILYSGEQHDPDLQLYNLRARYYNPTVGRFSQIDPFSGNQKSGANLFTYCESDPVNRTDPLGLYGIDVHQYLTRFLAEAVGFDDAVLIGLAAQELDEGAGAGTPYDRRAISGLDTWENMDTYHFVTQERLIHLASFMTGPDTARYQAMGEFFHAQEDSYAHSTGENNRNWQYYGGGMFGHAFQGHHPDQTWRRQQKAMRMARRVFEDLRNLRANNYLYANPELAVADPPENDADPLWQGIRGQVERFVAFVPQTYYDPFETATRQGTLNKVRILFPQYTLDEWDALYLSRIGPTVFRRPLPPAHGAELLMNLNVPLTGL